MLNAGGDFDVGAVLTPQLLGALLGLAALSLAAIPLKARLARAAPHDSGLAAPSTAKR